MMAETQTLSFSKSRRKARAETHTQGCQASASGWRLSNKLTVTAEVVSSLDTAPRHMENVAASGTLS